jgi:hypothetical protein
MGEGELPGQYKEFVDISIPSGQAINAPRIRGSY